MAAPGRTEPVRIREIVTPEGITLRFVVSTPIERAIAFLVDLALIQFAASLITLPVMLLAMAADRGIAGWGLAVMLLVMFLLRNFYFVFCESRWGGATFGKRWAGLRVVARNGGPLTGEAILARNLTREIEFFTPFTALLAPKSVLGGAPEWLIYISVGWLFVCGLLPLFNRERLRCGDLLGGTIVVRAPRAVLLPDLADPKTMLGGAEVPEAAYEFTTAQLDYYGIEELQVLEDLLRTHGRRGEREALTAVGRRIKQRIGWSGEVERANSESFLRAFYRAQRAHLERKMLFGQRKGRKQRPGRR